MAFQGYLAEEVAIDHADGLYSRREALRRLALLGLGMPAATALLAACGGDGEPALSSTTGAAEAAAPPTPAVDTQEITFPGPEGRTVRGAWAAADQPRGAVLVIHENRGLNDHIRSVAGRLAASGYSALTIDLLSPRAGPPPSAARPRRWPPSPAPPRSGSWPTCEPAWTSSSAGPPARSSARSGSASAAAWPGCCSPQVSPAWPRPHRSTAPSPKAPTSPAPPTRPCSASTPSRTTASTPPETRPQPPWNAQG